MSAGNPGQKIYVYAVFSSPNLSLRLVRVLTNVCLNSNYRPLGIYRPFDYADFCASQMLSSQEDAPPLGSIFTTLRGYLIAPPPQP